MSAAIVKAEPTAWPVLRRGDLVAVELYDEEHVGRVVRVVLIPPYSGKGEPKRYYRVAGLGVLVADRFTLIERATA